MFVVKRLGKNGIWSAVSLIDQNGSFRGEAKFETRREAEEYMAEYIRRMNKRLRITAGYGEIKIFDSQTVTDMPDKRESEKSQSKSKSKVYKRQEKKTRNYQSQF